MLELDAIDAFYGRAQVLAGVSLRVGAGEVVALVGRNGAGKSTTLKAAMGLVAPAKGRVTFEGARIDGLAPHRIARRGLGYVPEDRRVFAELTVAENLEVGRRAATGAGTGTGWTQERLYELFPALGELRARAAGRMSGGEQQMLAIARTLMGNPRLLLLDEPSEGLAPVVVEALARTLRALKGEGLSVLLSEQNLPFARSVADRGYAIETGRIRAEGALDALAPYLGV